MSVGCKRFIRALFLIQSRECWSNTQFWNHLLGPDSHNRTSSAWACQSNPGVVLAQPRGGPARCPRPARCPCPARSPGGRQLLQLLPVLHELRQALLNLLLPDGVVIGQLLSGVQDTLTGKNDWVNRCFQERASTSNSGLLHPAVG